MGCKFLKDKISGRRSRSKRSTHDVVKDISYTLHKGHTEAIDADLSKYFDTIPHAKLLAVVAERIAGGGNYILSSNG